MKPTFHTNLDEAKEDVYQLNGGSGRLNRVDNNDPIPRVGEKISFPFKKHMNNLLVECSFTLQVVDVTYDYINRIIRVELHIPPPHKNIAEWTEWFRKFRFNR